jgi:hypothetical protein
MCVQIVWNGLRLEFILYAQANFMTVRVNLIAIAIQRRTTDLTIPA